MELEIVYYAKPLQFSFQIWRASGDWDVDSYTYTSLGALVFKFPSEGMKNLVNTIDKA